MSFDLRFLVYVFPLLTCWLNASSGTSQAASAIEAGVHNHGKLSAHPVRSLSVAVAMPEPETGHLPHQVQAHDFEESKKKRDLSTNVEHSSSLSLNGVDKKYSVSLTSDGPVILGSTATFVATLKDRNPSRHRESSEAETFYYSWSGDPLFLPQLMWNGSVCELPIPFISKAGDMNVKVTVWASDKFFTKLAETSSTIRVTETINGKILMRSTSYPGCNTTDATCSIPSKSNVSLVADIYDPSNYFEAAVIVYMWDMGNGKSFQTTSPLQIYSYLVRGVYTIKANLTALLSGGETKYGYWQKSITVLDALTNLTIESSSTSVQVGKREVVNVTCKGSPPVEICVTVQEPGSQGLNDTNTTCATILDTKCFTTFSYHFQSSGEYVFQVAAKNNVSFLLNVSTIHAHPPPLPPKSITGITLAMIAGLLMTCFGMVVFVQQVQRNRKRHVEVANFDFQFRERSPSIPRWSAFSWPWNSAKKDQLLNRTSSYYDSL